MARLLGQYQGMPARYNPEKYDSYDEYAQEEKQAFQKLIEQQPPEGQLEGALFRIHRADGYAYYRIIEVDNTQDHEMLVLGVEHIPYIDGYRIPKEQMNGLTPETVEKYLMNKEHDF